MSKVIKGSKVKVHYTGSLSTGQIFDSSEGKEPLEFDVGSGMMIKGFDDAVYGMKIGDKKKAEIAAEDAYGQINQELVIEFSRDKLPGDLKPEVGMKLAMDNGSGQQIPVSITAVNEKSIEIDANHELAGKDLIFEIEMVEISNP